MTSYNDVMESAAEKLSGDERLRSNLTDDEFNPILDWAIAWLDEKMAKASDGTAARQIAQNELKRIELAMTAINDLLPAGTTPTLEEAVKLLNWKMPTQKIEVKDRVSLIKEVLKLIDEEWGKK